MGVAMSRYAVQTAKSTAPHWKLPALYDGAEKAARGWSMLWWFSATANITVRHGDQSWTLSQKKMRERRKSHR